ncbi:MAG: hypothetical protein KDJ31_16160, partial [Candidatus Competibacteraceae bacterium]|nr:hypothetical protein [Candidatus Competibacteraceae bacterium]
MTGQQLIGDHAKSKQIGAGRGRFAARALKSRGRGSVGRKRDLRISWRGEPPQPVDVPCIYQLRIVLRGIGPLIWRRVRVRSDICLAELHDVLQIVMDWSDIGVWQRFLH